MFGLLSNCNVGVCPHLSFLPSLLPFFLTLPLPSFSTPHSQTAELIRALQELENSATGDSALCQRISCLPAEVLDTSLLHRITGGPWHTLLSHTLAPATVSPAECSRVPLFAGVVREVVLLQSVAWPLHYCCADPCKCPSCF